MPRAENAIFSLPWKLWGFSYYCSVAASWSGFQPYVRKGRVTAIVARKYETDAKIEISIYSYPDVGSTSCCQRSRIAAHTAIVKGFYIMQLQKVGFSDVVNLSFQPSTCGAGVPHVAVLVPPPAGDTSCLHRLADRLTAMHASQH